MSEKVSVSVIQTPEKTKNKTGTDNGAFVMEMNVIESNYSKSQRKKSDTGEGNMIEGRFVDHSSHQHSESMMSLQSNASTTSRSSVNCTNGRIKLQTSIMKRLFSYSPETGFASARETLDSLILPEKDGEVIGRWLLTEIDHWDIHYERIVVLTTRTLILVHFDFVKSKLVQYERRELSTLKSVTAGMIVYPKKSVNPKCEFGGVKLDWSDGNEKLTVKQRWNPFNETMPFVCLTSHPIHYNEIEKETTTYNCDEFISALEYALNWGGVTGVQVKIQEAPVLINSYASLAAALFNQNRLGYQFERWPKNK